MESDQISSRFVGLFVFCQQSSIHSKRDQLLTKDGIRAFKDLIEENLNLNDKNLKLNSKIWIQFCFKNFLNDQRTNEILQLKFYEYFKYFYIKWIHIID